MDTLIRSAEVSYSLQNKRDIKNGIELFKAKIEDVISNFKSVIIIMTNHFAECRNSVHIEEYEFDDDYLHISENNFEIHINFNNVTDLKYNRTYDEFVIMYGDDEIVFNFLNI